MGLTLITAPSIEPITLSDAKLHARIDTSADDTIVTRLIQAARERAEFETRHALITQTWDYTLDGFPADRLCRIELPLPNLISVTSIKYIDTDGVLQTWAASNYKVHTNYIPGQISTAYAIQWPTSRAEADAVTIRYVAGYGASASNVPQSIISAMHLMIAHWYEHRSAVEEVSMTEVPMAAKALLDMSTLVRY